ncbi:uncharacterized protein LOC120130704 [Hibiscus syriacus]|uniref:uncharacterized protein LOC120130704 n=1 Tax=Hibiscus syriacus TaxID=106335 RepID=UPI001924EF4F|nr:uncharacterized protein LOC120130704 [Hibiscus syriacus]
MENSLSDHLTGITERKRPRVAVYMILVDLCSSNCVADYAGRISRSPLESTPDNSDAESSFPYSCDKRDPHSSPVVADEVFDIHELELRAYKSTVKALYASGPLTWRQEFLLTNLRLSLNISDEEHLLQLRHLLSAQVL